jgi:hypothetical protein
MALELIVSHDYVTIRRVGGAVETSPRILVGEPGSPYVGVYRFVNDVFETDEYPDGDYDALVKWSELTPEQVAAATENARRIVESSQ